MIESGICTPTVFCIKIRVFAENNGAEVQNDDSGVDYSGNGGNCVGALLLYRGRCESGQALRKNARGGQKR